MAFGGDWWCYILVQSAWSQASTAILPPMLQSQSGNKSGSGQGVPVKAASSTIQLATNVGYAR